MDQGAEADVAIIPDAQVRKLFKRYHTRCDRKPLLPHEEPTAEQLSALKPLLDADAAPFADFAVFGPFGRRHSK
eukprot:5690899-Amphidinium_carterae.1